MCFFCLGAFFGSLICKKAGPKITLIISGVLVAIGFVSTGFLNKSTPHSLLYITYAVLAGTGIGIAYNVKVSKMKCGHHGSNYPVKNIKTGKVEITSQNYSYTFDEESIQQSDLGITIGNVITKEIEGISDVNNGVIGIQYEPNTPIDENSEDIIKDFVEKMRKLGGKRHA